MNGESAVEAAITRGVFLSEAITLSSATLLLYDHAINFSEEVEHFWSKPWSFSSIIYFLIRYLGFVQAIILILGYAARLMPLTTQVLVAFALSIITMILCQAAITTRVWYLFPSSPVIRGFAITSFALSSTATILLGSILWKDVRGEASGLSAPSPLIAWIYAPSVVIHSVLFALKIYRFLISSSNMQKNSLLWRFLKEGMFMYAFALASLLFALIGLTMINPSEISTYEMALGGSGLLVVATTVVSVCRAMLSIRSLASTAHVDPAWLLNHAELSRVRWRPGLTEGEIIVEVDDDPEGLHLPVIDLFPMERDSMASDGTECSGQFRSFMDWKV